MNSNFSPVFSALRRIVLLPSFCLAAGLAGCSSSNPSANTQVEKASAVSQTGKAAPTDSLLKEGAMAKELTKNNEAESPSKDFSPSEKICLALKLHGRPKTGIVKAKFYCDKDFITETTVDVATLNKDVLFSVGETTNVGFSLTHQSPFPVSDKYRVETFFDDKPLETYKFSVVAPAGDAPAKSDEAAPASKE